MCHRRYDRNSPNVVPMTPRRAMSHRRLATLTPMAIFRRSMFLAGPCVPRRRHVTGEISLSRIQSSIRTKTRQLETFHEHSQPTLVPNLLRRDIARHYVDSSMAMTFIPSMKISAPTEAPCAQKQSREVIGIHEPLMIVVTLAPRASHTVIAHQG